MASEEDPLATGPQLRSHVRRLERRDVEASVAASMDDPRVPALDRLDVAFVPTGYPSGFRQTKATFRTASTSSRGALPTTTMGLAPDFSFTDCFKGSALPYEEVDTMISKQEVEKGAPGSTSVGLVESLPPGFVNSNQSGKNIRSSTRQRVLALPQQVLAESSSLPDTVTLGTEGTPHALRSAAQQRLMVEYQMSMAERGQTTTVPKGKERAVVMFTQQRQTRSVGESEGKDEDEEPVFDFDEEALGNVAEKHTPHIGVSSPLPVSNPSIDYSTTARSPKNSDSLGENERMSQQYLDLVHQHLIMPETKDQTTSDQYQRIPHLSRHNLSSGGFVRLLLVRGDLVDYQQPGSLKLKTLPTSVAVHRSVSFEELVPQILRATGIQPPPGLFGRDQVVRADPLGCTSKDWRDELFIEVSGTRRREWTPLMNDIDWAKHLRDCVFQCHTPSSHSGGSVLPALRVLVHLPRQWLAVAKANVAGKSMTSQASANPPVWPDSAHLRTPSSVLRPAASNRATSSGARRITVGRLCGDASQPRWRPVRPRGEVTESQKQEKLERLRELARFYSARLDQGDARLAAR